MQNSPVAIGQTIADKYQIEKVIGEGGMGLVVSAWHLGLQQRVAIKFVLADLALEQGSTSERFRREARAAARIRSEHVCRVLDVGTLDNGVPFMVMEYLEGCDLAAELARQSRLSVTDAIEFILQACEALAEAHAAEIVHRDLKPANLFLARRADGTRAIKVLDFGVSKSLSDAGVSRLTLTKSATLIGSPIYMSPEQLESSKDVDARTDIWALGAILYELLSGRTPFDAQTMPQLVAAVLHTEPPRFAQLGVTLPPGLEAVVLRALAKNRDQRHASVAEFTQELAPYAPAQAAVSVNRVARVLGPGARERSAVPMSDPSSARAARTPQPVERTSAPDTSARGPRRMLWAVLALLPLMVGIGMLLSRSEGDHVHVVAGTRSADQAPAPAAVEPAMPATARALPSAVALRDAGTAADTEARVVESAEGVAAPPATPIATPASTTSSTTSTPSTIRPSRAKRAASDTPRQNPAEPPSGISDFGGRR